jgi:hypothetical protein
VMPIVRDADLDVVGRPLQILGVGPSATIRVDEAGRPKQ